MMCRQHVRINFPHLDVEGAIGGCYDSVAVYDGSSPAASLLTLLCGNSVPEDIVSSGNSMLVVFSSDGSITQGGFSIEYITEPEEVATGTVNRIHHHHYKTNPCMAL